MPDTLRCAARLLLLLPLMAGLPGCAVLVAETASTAAGVTGAGVSDAVGANAAATTAIGLGVQAVGRAGLQYAQRRAHGSAQDGIARAAGPLPVGGVARWSVSHTLPIEPDEQGEVTVARLIGAGGLECKEIVFSVDRKRERGFYTATICRDGEVWRWASAEPATARWGSLQ
ncbi:hypothetical protein [Belnapia sp. F-4-1]|uniref:hypothetical protein n=1 Tax=Belnapia sp. F-4-1 TaxID=1545443 RepID=UPI0005BAEAB8|nr:hypothetical protein [Belnapia sp. F-4-1]